MDQVCDLNNVQDIISFINRAKEHLSPDFLCILLGPTASGKTKLAVQLAKALDGEIISADSRQVYQGLDLGTGKDLPEYDGISYHLIDIVPTDIHYEVKTFKRDFQEAFAKIKAKGKLPILCGGTGSYIQSLLQDQPYSHIPKSEDFHVEHRGFTKEELIARLKQEAIPADFQIDWDNHKRLIRALEIVVYLKTHPLPKAASKLNFDYLILGLNPDLAERRTRIDIRLEKRIDEGLIDEIQGLLNKGLSHEQIQWFGLEYKFGSMYLLGELDKTGFQQKLQTEIHRFAKRQMTYFRKMEKDGLKIHWIKKRE